MCSAFGLTALSHTTPRRDLEWLTTFASLVDAVRFWQATVVMDEVPTHLQEAAQALLLDLKRGKCPHQDDDGVATTKQYCAASQNWLVCSRCGRRWVKVSTKNGKFEWKIDDRDAPGRQRGRASQASSSRSGPSSSASQTSPVIIGAFLVGQASSSRSQPTIRPRPPTQSPSPTPPLAEESDPAESNLGMDSDQSVDWQRV